MDMQVLTDKSSMKIRTNKPALHQAIDIKWRCDSSCQRLQRVGRRSGVAGFD